MFRVMRHVRFLVKALSDPTEGSLKDRVTRQSVPQRRGRAALSRVLVQLRYSHCRTPVFLIQCFHVSSRLRFARSSSSQIRSSLVESFLLYQEMR
jgi:hypothetical protein